jgi:hypothetical protein
VDANGVGELPGDVEVVGALGGGSYDDGIRTGLLITQQLFGFAP